MIDRLRRRPTAPPAAPSAEEELRAQLAAATAALAELQEVADRLRERAEDFERRLAGVEHTTEGLQERWDRDDR